MAMELTFRKNASHNLFKKSGSQVYIYRTQICGQTQEVMAGGSWKAEQAVSCICYEVKKKKKTI